MTNTIYNIPDDVTLSFLLKQLDPEKVTPYSIEIPQGKYDIDGFTEWCNEYWESEEIPISFSKNEFSHTYNIACDEGYELKIDYKNSSTSILHELGFDEVQDEFADILVGDNQIKLSSRFTVYIRCPTLSVESIVAGWQTGDDNIIARVPIETGLGVTFHYEPNTPISNPFRSGTISLLTFELLDEYGRGLVLEDDTEWTISIDFIITRGDTMANMPTSFMNLLGDTTVNESKLAKVDFLQRRFDRA